MCATLLAAGTGAAQEPLAPAQETVACRGSAIQVGSQVRFVAGSDTECLDGDAGTPPPTRIGDSPFAEVGALYARSSNEEDPDGDSTVGTGSANVIGSAEAGATSILLGSGNSSLEIAVARAEARVRCVSGQPVVEASSSLAEVVANGQPAAIGATHTHLPNPAGGVVHFNHGDPGPADGPTGVTRRAVWVDTGGSADIVVGEAHVSYAGNPCTGRIEIAQNAVPDDSSFTFAFTGPNATGYALRDEDSRTFDLSPGSYGIDQTEAPFPLADVACVGDEVDRAQTNADVVVELQRTEHVSCTFVNVSESICAGGTIGADGKCYLPPNCPAGTVLSADGTQCLLPPQCPPGSVPDGQGHCVILNVACPDGTTLDSQGRCVLPSECPPGTFRSATGACVPFECLEGFVLDVTGRCVSPPRSRCGAAVTILRTGIIGTPRSDRITGTNRSDKIIAAQGNDRVSGGRGNDCMEGGSGRDTLDGSNGRDRMYGDSGNDAMNGGTGPDLMLAGTGRDRLTGGSGSDRMDGGSGRDRMSGGLGNDVMSGGGGPDFIDSGNGRNRIDGGPGNDVINAATAGPPERINCGAGFDVVRMNANDTSRNCERVFVLRRTAR